MSSLEIRDDKDQGHDATTPCHSKDIQCVALDQLSVPNDELLQTASPTRCHPDDFHSGGKLELQGKFRGWLVVVACFILYFNMLGVSYAFGVFEAHYALHEFPGQAAKISLIGSTSGGISLAIALVAGRWVELYGVRAVTAAGGIIFSGSLAAAGFCKSLTMLILTQGIFAGVGFGLLLVPGTVAAIPWFPHKQSLVLGIVSSGAGLGGIFWSFITRIIISKLSYQWALWIMAAISGGLEVVAVILIKDATTGSNKSWRRAGTGAGLERQSSSSYREALKILKNTKFLTYYIGNALLLFAYFVPWFYIPTFAQTRLKASAFEGAVLSAVINLGMSSGRILLGYFADTSFGTMNTIIISSGLSGVAQLCLWIPSFFMNSIILLYICAFVYGFFGGGCAGIVPVVLVQLFPPDRLPFIVGIFMTNDLPGAIAGSPIAGAIFEKGHRENWVPVIIYSSSMILLGTLVISITRFQVERRLLATV